MNNFNGIYGIGEINGNSVDMDQQDSQEDPPVSQTLSLTSFLFGNIDDRGQLEGDVFDDDVKKQLASLSRLGLGSLLRQVTNDSNDEEDSDDDEEEELDDDDVLEKSPNAIDYSDINEVLEEDYVPSQISGVSTSNLTLLTSQPPASEEDYDDGEDGDQSMYDLGAAHDDNAGSGSVDAETPVVSEMEPLDANAGVVHMNGMHEMEDEDNDGMNTIKTDVELMPPPPPPTHGGNGEEVSDDKEVNSEGKLVTPLAAMRPSKYAHVDVAELFPGFKADKVLRFSRLFGPNKNTIPASRSIWKHIKRKKKRRNAVETPFEGLTPSGDGREDLGYGDQEEDFVLKFPPAPYIERTESEERYASPLNTRPKNSSSRRGAKDSQGGGEASEDDAANRRQSNKPKASDWRYGPAQLWYDMIDVPAVVENFDYGFKVKNAPVKKDPSDGGNESAKRLLLPTADHKTEEHDVKLTASSHADFDNKYYDADEDNDDDDIPDDAFHMITQYNWEDDIIWNGDDLKHKIQQKRKNMAAGWVPSSYNRTAQAFSQPGGSGGAVGAAGARQGAQAFVPPVPQPPAASKAKSGGNNGEDDTWYSIFPVENEDLVYSRWEDNIIWDPDNMDKIPEPPILTLDPNDENIILGIPEDIDPATLNQEEAPVKVKIPHPHVKKSKILLGKAGVITTIEEESPPPPPKSPDKDPFNLSNDEYYSAKGQDQIIKISMAGGLLQHSTPIVELQAPFIPTYMGEKKLRHFHRPPLKRFSHGVLSSPGSHSVHSLAKEIKKKEKQRDQERLASGGGDVFFMRTPDDLTGKDGDLILVEYVEENPPLLSYTGMCTRIKNYYKRRACNDKGPPEYRFGETAYAHTSPFLGSMHPGQSIQTLENNMYRAPLYEHKMPPTDFIVIRTRNGYSIREAEALFCSGQECPLYEVPGPNSKSANNYVRDFLQVFIYRLFWKSRDEPRRIKMDEIKRAFPTHSESSIRKRLKPCADFKRTGVDSNWWVIKPEFRLPTEEEIRAMVSPEQCCAFGSMLAAEQRLKDAGYGDKFLSALEDDNEDDTQKLDDEVKVAPWHTTRAYIHAVKGKCLLQLTGPADPTGCGEGFSYIRIPNKPTQNKEEQEQQPKRIVTGTDADLRRLSLNNAKGLLKEYGVPDEEIKKLSRWEVIDVVRTLSTEKAKAGEEGMNKFSRGNRFSIAEHQERYKEECQRIFDLQNRVLASEEVLSTDEGSSEEEDNDSDMEEKGKYIENILANKKTSSQMSLEKEEQERKELQKMMMSEEDRALEKKKQNKKEEDDNSRYGFGTPGRVLKITRTFRSADGREYQRVEIVRKTAFIDTYVKIRTTKDETFIKDFVGQLDDVQKEEMKRERRRLQEQLRRIKRNQEKAARGIVTPPRPKKPKLKKWLLSCDSCPKVGHMRTNKACPLYTGPGGGGADGVSVIGSTGNSMMDSLPGASNYGDSDVKKKMSLDDSLDDADRGAGFDDSDELINVDGTKIKLSSKVMKHAEELKRRSQGSRSRGRDSLSSDFGAVGGRGSKRRRAGTVVHCDYLKRKHKSVNRRRIDPVITLSTILEDILNQMREMPDAQPFIRPVNPKLVPDYYNLVEAPMDLSTMRENLRQRKYQSREEFLSDVSQIVENSKKYNGEASTLTVTAGRMLELCITKFAEQEDRLMRLEKAINPLLDDDDQVAFDFILDNIVQKKIVTTNDSWPFMKPVSKKNVKDYYDIIQNPMDLSTVIKKVKNHKYHSRAEFITDFQLIHENSQVYNGPDSSYSKKAEALLQIVTESLDEYGDHLSELEGKMALARERIAEQTEADSLVSGEEDELHGADGSSIGPAPERYSDDDGGAEPRDDKRGVAEAMMALSSSSSYRPPYPETEDSKSGITLLTNYDASAAPPSTSSELLGTATVKQEPVDVESAYPMDTASFMPTPNYDSFEQDVKPVIIPGGGLRFGAPGYLPTAFKRSPSFRDDGRGYQDSDPIYPDGGPSFPEDSLVSSFSGDIPGPSFPDDASIPMDEGTTPSDPDFPTGDNFAIRLPLPPATMGNADASDNFLGPPSDIPQSDRGEQQQQAGFSAIAGDLDISDSDDEADMEEVPPAEDVSAADDMIF
ncbi:transcription initiation factor TFIID subunit 1 [Hyalella azteca]|uniref:Transcription initiation factor TFIID subunit 1 n=1 Tax=Hyalella azteca TaxID=294128 RepID=A0A8B7N611_HYAAZ|nr:transcription initiation factor TFIID subunit 1 [Hyalella azteca]